jgi:single-stranded-DNA-specific exonuclease
MRWNHTPQAPEEVAALSRAAGVSRVVAELLLRGGWTDGAAAMDFLRPELASLADPFAIRGLEAAVARLAAAIAAGETVVVLGDYDVDGVSSTALLVTVLRRFGLNPRFVVPRRAEDGYGLSRSAIDRALEGEPAPTLFVALDCGTNSHEEVAYLIGRGLDVIVVDHHRSKERPLAQGLLVNPHVGAPTAAAESGGAPILAKGEGAGAVTAPTGQAAAAKPRLEEPWLNLCTVGLVFKVVHGLLKRLRNEQHPVALALKLRDQLDLVAMGTVADLVPLVGENRILARHGLRILQETRRPGLRALMEISGIARGQAIAPSDISFRLGPRINASGRLADAALSVELLLSEDAAFCYETARQLDTFNRERQEIERKITDEADRLVETHYRADPGIVLFSEAWHPGVVGIVAGRVSRHYHRPCIVLGNEGDQAKGSGRSVEGVNLVEILGGCGEHLSSWGGHPMAVGVALPKVRLEDFRMRFAAAVRAQVGHGIPERRLEVAAWLDPQHVHEELMDELDRLHPFGQGNPQPVFGLGGVSLRRRPEVFKERHFRFWLEGARGRPLPGVAWKMAERLPPVGVPVDLAVELGWNHFNDRKLLQLELIDWRPADGAAVGGGG